MRRGWVYYRDATLIVAPFLLLIPVILVAAVAFYVWHAIEIGWAIGWKANQWGERRITALANYERTLKGDAQQKD